METFPADARNDIESELVDLEMVSLAAVSQWRCAAMQAAMNDVMRCAENSQVCDNGPLQRWAKLTTQAHAG
jgi:hypothetical protein